MMGNERLCNRRAGRAAAIGASLAGAVLLGCGACSGRTVPAALASGRPELTVLSNPDGPCLVLDGVRDRVIENYAIGPCGGAGVEIRGGANVTIRSSVITHTRGDGVHVEDSRNVVVEETRIQSAATGVYALTSSGVRVACTSIEDVKGPGPRGQAVQFDKVLGGDNSVRCNAFRNAPASPGPEDIVSVFQSQGEAELPIRIVNNLVIGGGASRSGGGIMLGDNGGTFQVAEGNVLVDPGQYGVAIASGEGMNIIRNRVYAQRSAITNVGIYVWNQSPSACARVTISDNQVNWTSSQGAANAFFDGHNCGPVAGRETNDFAAAIDASLVHAPAPVTCSCTREGWR